LTIISCLFLKISSPSIFRLLKSREMTSLHWIQEFHIGGKYIVLLVTSHAESLLNVFSFSNFSADIYTLILLFHSAITFFGTVQYRCSHLWKCHFLFQTNYKFLNSHSSKFIFILVFYYWSMKIVSIKNVTPILLNIKLF
jgi:hypothetical protein